jgi:hypothetical protein
MKHNSSSPVCLPMSGIRHFVVVGGARCSGPNPSTWLPCAHNLDSGARWPAANLLVQPGSLWLAASSPPPRCMSWGPDPDGVNGVYLGKNVTSEAAKALKMALTAVTSKVRGAGPSFRLTN